MKTNNRETLSTLGTQDTRWRQTIARRCQHWGNKIQDEEKQSRDTVNIGEARYGMKTNHRETLSTLGTQDTGWRQTIEIQYQHWAHKIQDEEKHLRDNVNIGHTRYRMKTNNGETMSTLGTQVTEWRQTIQRHCQHWAHKIEDEDKQSRDTVNIGHTRYKMRTNNRETLSTLGKQDTWWKQTIERHCQHWPSKIQDTNNRETLSTLGTQDIGWRQTIERQCQHWAHKIQDEDKQSRYNINIWHTRYRMKKNTRETMSTLGTQDTGWRKTIERQCQHWGSKIQDEDKQSIDTVNIGEARYGMKTNHRETLSTLGHKIQDEDKQSRDNIDIWHTRYRMKKNNGETMSTLGT
jgi:hypothetical protein